MTSVIAMAGLALEQSEQLARSRRRLHTQLLGLAARRRSDPDAAGARRTARGSGGGRRRRGRPGRPAHRLVGATAGGPRHARSSSPNRTEGVTVCVSAADDDLSRRGRDALRHPDRRLGAGRRTTPSRARTLRPSRHCASSGHRRRALRRHGRIEHPQRSRDRRGAPGGRVAARAAARPRRARHRRELEHSLRMLAGARCARRAGGLALGDPSAHAALPHRPGGRRCWGSTCRRSPRAPSSGRCCRPRGTDRCCRQLPTPAAASSSARQRATSSAVCSIRSSTASNRRVGRSLATRSTVSIRP